MPYYLGRGHEKLIITVNFLRPFIEITKEKSKKIKLERGSTVGDLIDVLIKKYGDELEARIFKGGKVREEILVAKNGVSISAHEGIRTKLKEGDEILFAPFVEGG